MKEKYPNVKFVFGDLNSSDVIANAAAAADIVVRMLSFSVSRFVKVKDS